MSLVWCHLRAAPGQLGDDSTPQLPDGAIDLLDKVWKSLCLQQGDDRGTLKQETSVVLVA